MLSLRLPSNENVANLLATVGDEPVTYSYPRVTESGAAPRGFDSDRHRVILGYGLDIFERARQAITEWQMFDHPMTKLFWTDRPIKVGTCVAVRFRIGPCWSLNPCRIIYTIDETTRFGFGYGTLPGHLECGEEKFLVELDPGDGSVWYELHAVSRPSHLLTRLGYPVARLAQARFRRLSGEAMQRAHGAGRRDQT